jgi:hypothetical protein
MSVGIQASLTRGVQASLSMLVDPDHPDHHRKENQAQR